MESWRGYLNEETMITGEDLLNDLKLKLTYLAARAAGREAVNQFIKEVGPQIAAAAAEGVKAIPLLGNVVSGLAGIWASVGASVATVRASKEIMEKASEVLQIAAGTYAVNFDDSKVGKNPLAKLFNIDDRMELPLKDEYLKVFASKLVAHLTDNPNTHFNPESFADVALANWIKISPQTKWSDAAPPDNPA